MILNLLTDEFSDGSLGVGEQMSALEIVQANLISSTSGPVTNSTGGTSVGNNDAGSSTASEDATAYSSISTGDKVGAGFLTAFILISLIMGGLWMAVG